MIITVGTYADFLDAKVALGPPKALFFTYFAANLPSPAQARIVSIYEGGIAFKTTSAITSDVPTPTDILADFPEAVQVSHIAVE